MKTATLPSLRVEEKLRQDAEAALVEGETLSNFIETSVRESIQRRRVQAEFLSRGLLSSQESKISGIYHSTQSVHRQLQEMLDAKRKKVLG